jgi:carboxyl-terminal processing protease
MSSQTRYVRFVLVLIAVLLTGCAPGEQQAAEPQAAEPQAAEPQAAEPQAAVMSPEAKAHLDELLELMQRHSINRLTIDWDDFRKKVFAKATGAKSIEDTRPAVEEALRLLADRHSFYQPKFGSVIRWGTCTTVPVSTAPVSRPEVPSTVGYIRVSAFLGTSTEAAFYSDFIQQTIKFADSRGVTGWLVDLRQNTGGNMLPMITGLSPILGDGALVYFVDPTGAKVVWELRDGVAFINGNVVDQNQATYRIQNEAPRVAVLTDALTASAGEAVAIAFKGRSGTRSFGTPTCGASTANQAFPLSNGDMLILTGAVMADRTEKPYGGPVVPDEVIEDPATAVERAIEWLKAGN